MDYLELCEVYEKLEKTSKRLEKTDTVSKLIEKTPAEDLDTVSLLLQGRVFPPWDERKIGFAARTVVKAINQATGVSVSEIEKEFNKTGDLGVVAFELSSSRRQATLLYKKLTVKKVFENIQKLASLEGAGTVSNKINLVVELLTSAKPLEAKYIIRTLLEELRVGVGQGSLRDAIVWAFFSKGMWKYDEKENNIVFTSESSRKDYNEITDKVQHAIDMSSDLGAVAKAAKKGLKELESIVMQPLHPIKVMLSLRVKTIEEGFKAVGSPAEFEYKLDGFRMQVHKKGREIIILQDAWKM